jgi:hypothetical protein
LGAGEVARVSGVSLGGPLVSAVAAARGTDARSATDSLVEDALAAEGARARRVDDERGPRWATTVALARRVPLVLAQDARAAGPPSDAELATIAVVHAVVRRTHSLDPARGLALASRVRDAVVGARDEGEFMERASVATKGVLASVERLPPFDATGHMEDGNELDPDFVAGAFSLGTPGDVSPVVETSFGWHVIRLVSRVVPSGPGAEARRAAVLPVIEALRARTRLAELLRARRGSTPVEISAAADALMSLAGTAP